jgi:hypothetical protein
MKKQEGFSLAEVLLVVLLAGALGFSGWYVWNNSHQNKTDSITSDERINENNKADETSSDSEKPEGKISETKELETQALSWKLVKSGQGGFTINIPDGWSVTNELEGNFVYGQSLEYLQGTEAKVDTIDSYAGDSQFRIRIIQLPNEQFGGNTTEEDEEFTTLGGLKGTKHYTKTAVEPCDGIGCGVGSEYYSYFFKGDKKSTSITYTVFNYNEYSKDVYNIEKSDTNQEAVVDAMVKTLKVND